MKPSMIRCPECGNIGMTAEGIDLREENEALKAELLEEARLSGMGSEREAKLLTEVKQLRGIFDELTKRTFPGEFDSGDALRAYIEALRNGATK